MKASIGSIIPAIITSPQLRTMRRSMAALRRKLVRGQRVIHYFHQVDDPYSWLAARALGHLQDTYDVQVVPMLVPPPDPSAAPDIERLRHWSLRDAQRLAARWRLEPVPQILPDAGSLAAAEAALAGVSDARAFSQCCAAIEDAWRSGAAMPASTGEAAAALAKGAEQRAKLGHYLGGTFHFESEWFWGLDRLHYLEQRLAGIAGCAPEFFAPLNEIALPALPGTKPAVLEAFISLRSPYTYIAMERLGALASHYGAQLKLRPVLPMVMRGLPVPLAKRLYIVRDTAREAERLGLPFGRIADPVGRPTERGLAITFHAMKSGKGADFAQSFLKGVFADGIDAGTDKGLLALCERAGLTAADMAAALLDESWRSEAQSNCDALLELGIWGVPAFRVNDMPAHWGQDRLWAVEEDIAAATGY
jgi:2-hydroxychromene-2-carboxylate isomerase